MTAKCKTLLLLSLLFTVPLMADTVSLEEAQEKALQFFSQASTSSGTGRRYVRAKGRMKLAHRADTRTGTPAYYIFNDEEKGFVVVAGDDCASEILGYSSNGSFDSDNIPAGLKDILDSYKREIEFAEQQPRKGKARRVNSKWENIAPMVLTKWDQGSPYNALCPIDPDDGKRCYTGCTTTAVAQILYYHQFPEVGRGYVSYKWRDQTLSQDLSQIRFEWDKMKDKDNSDSAIAKLMYSVALVCGADFSSQSTPAGVGSQDLYKYFCYKNQIDYLSLEDTSLETFEATIYNELSEERPVLFTSWDPTSDGHMMVIDGYNKQYGMFHINMGWSGMDDGYYQLTAIDVDFYNFTADQGILYNIEPDRDAPSESGLYPSTSYVLSYDLTELTEWKGPEEEIDMTPDMSFWNVEEIKGDAFKDNTTLRFVNLPSNTETIYPNAFNGCSELESVYIPSSVTYIGGGAFSNCPSLTNFMVSEDSPMFSGGNGMLFNYQESRLVACGGGVNGSVFVPDGIRSIENSAFKGVRVSSVVIPSSVSFIGSETFSGCELLTSITLPSSISSVEERTFENCTGLKQIVVLATTPPQVREGAFNGVDCSSVYLCVPAESLDQYLHSHGWEQFTTVIGVSQPEAKKLVIYMKDGSFESFMLSEMPIIKNTDDELIVSTSSSTRSFKMDRIQRIQYFEEADDPTPHEEDASYAVFDNGVLTFYYDKLIKTRNGAKYKLNTGDNSPGWLGAGGVSKVVFDSSFANTRPTTTYEWFKGFSSLTSFEGMEYLNTSEVINMAKMYEGCNSLSTLDVRHFSTAKVTDMSRMFYGCSALTSLNVGNFNTANCTNMEEMFMNDYQLTSLDLSHFDMSKCTQTKGMMKNCSALKSLSLSSTMGRLAEDACEGVGSPQDRCDIIAPEGFDFGVDTSNGYFKWKSGFFRLGNTPFALSSYEKTMKYGETEKVQLIGGHGDYTISNSQPEVVTVLLDEEVLVITAIGAGRATISVTDNKVQQIVTLNVIVTRQSTIEVEPRSISFGNMTLGTTKSEHFTVYNTGEGILTFHIDYSTLGGIFNVLEGNQEYILGPEESKQFTIVCSISDDYEYYGGGIAIYVRSDATNEVSVMVSVSVSVSHEKHIPAEAIDLGLPSGTKWASYNVGATKPEEIGSKYAWGETETKNTFRWSNYIHCDGTKDSCHDIGNDISGTEYDVARAKWGNEWQMPTYTQYKELLDCCSLEPGTKNGVNGCKIIGPNGQSIFMPYTDDGVFTATYWSASLNYIGKAYFMALCGMEGDFNPHMVSYPQYTGCCIRPVISTDLSNINYEVLNFNELPKHSNIKIYDTSGKMIKNERTGENPQALNLHDLEKGVYLVNVNGVTYKIVRK